MNIYVHIPFCHSKCAYCAFLSHCNINDEDAYVTALGSEIHNSSFIAHDSITTIYFGGGTPSMINPSNIAEIIETLRESSPFAAEIEITLESNPEDINNESLLAWKAAGINRLSIGVQSLNDAVRKKIGRTLRSAEVLRRIRLASSIFPNVAIDLISALPEETNESLCSTLERIIELGIPHISLYDLETNNESAIGKNPQKFALPNDEHASEMLLSSWRILAGNGYEQYEISNFARKQNASSKGLSLNGPTVVGRKGSSLDPNYNYCRHNLDFWNGQDYLGFGLGAASRIGANITTNSSKFETYLAETKDDRTVETLSQGELLRLEVASSLRLNKLINEVIFVSTKGLESLYLEGLITSVENPYLTPRGKLLSDSVLRFLLDDVKL